MGVDPAGTVTFFSAAEQMLGYRAAEVVGVHSIADFIDPAQIDERRQTIDAMRTALEPVDAETAAECLDRHAQGRPERRCVVRVRALPVPTPDPALDKERPEDPEPVETRPDTERLDAPRTTGRRSTAATWSSPST